MLLVYNGQTLDGASTLASLGIKAAAARGADPDLDPFCAQPPFIRPLYFDQRGWTVTHFPLGTRPRVVGDPADNDGMTHVGV
jgi:hypothetical protein